MGAYAYSGTVSFVDSTLVTDPKHSMASAFSMVGGSGAELADNGLFTSPQLSQAVPLSCRIAFDNKTRYTVDPHHVSYTVLTSPATRSLGSLYTHVFQRVLGHSRHKPSISTTASVPLLGHTMAASP